MSWNPIESPFSTVEGILCPNDDTTRAPDIYFYIRYKGDSQQEVSRRLAKYLLQEIPFLEAQGIK